MMLLIWGSVTAEKSKIFAVIWCFSKYSLSLELTVRLDEIVCPGLIYEVSQNYKVTLTVNNWAESW